MYIEVLFISSRMLEWRYVILHSLRLVFMSISRHVSHSVTVSWYHIYSRYGIQWDIDSVFVGLPNSFSFIANLNIVTSLCVHACVHACIC